MLVAVHGGEPMGWELEVARTLTRWPDVAVRVLAVTDVPVAPAAPLLPAARAALDRARTEFRRLEAARVTERLAALRARLPAEPEVVWVHVTDADPGRAIVEHAAASGANLIVVGSDRAGWLHTRLLGAIHERVVALASCAVLTLTPPARVDARARTGAPRAAAAKGGA